MLSKKLESAINKQINAEFYSAYLYLSMAAQAQAKNLLGTANWFRCQAQEEVLHAMKFNKYMGDRGGRVALDSIEKPPTEWASPLAMYEDAYEHETKVTKMIHALVSLADEEKDYATTSFLKWFVDEQVEEEASADEVVQKLKLAGDTGAGLFMVDQELAQRVFTYPATLDGAAE